MDRPLLFCLSHATPTVNYVQSHGKAAMLWRLIKAPHDTQL